MPDRRKSATERQARLAAIRAEQRRKKNRRSLWIGSIAGVLVLALVGVSAIVIRDAGREQAALDAVANRPIEGVQTIEGLPFTHVTTAVDYPQTPPAGGAHAAAWLNCGVYSDPVPSENAVHSLEHGAVWITYDPSLPSEEITILEELAAGENYLLVSPFEGMDTPITVSSWGYQLGVQNTSDERIATFIQKYLLNPELAEAGAACSNGVGIPA